MKRQSGFSLIEVLVALLITSLGTLGWAAFLVAVMQESRAVVLQAHIGFYLTDMLERIQANPTASYQVDFGERPAVSMDCTRQACPPEMMAAYEVGHWKCALAGTESDLCPEKAAEGDVLTLCHSLDLGDDCFALPGGDGSIQVTDQDYQITVRWRRIGAETDAYDEASLSARR